MGRRDWAGRSARVRHPVRTSVHPEAGIRVPGDLATRCTFGYSRCPFTLARPEAVDYDPALFPGSYKGLERILVLPWNENYSDEHLDASGSSIQDAARRLAR